MKKLITIILAMIMTFFSAPQKGANQPHVTAEKEERRIGVWGQRHLRYIRDHRKVFYTNLLTSGKLQSHLADIEEQAQELFDRLMKQRAEREGITEKLKADNQMEWVGRMNNLRSAVTETVNAEVVFV